MKRIILFALLASLLTLIFTGCNISAKESFDINTVESYKDIPGITKDDITAVEALKASRASFSYSHMLSTEAFPLSDGTYEGFTYKYCELLTSLFGIEFIPEAYNSWDELSKLYMDGKIDFNGDITPTAERMKTLQMTHAIAERALCVYKFGDPIRSINDISGLNIGSFVSTITAQTILDTYPVVFNVVDIYDYDDAISKMKSGEIDACIMEAIVDPAFEKYEDIKSYEIFQLVYTPVSMSTANPDLTPIITVVNKYLTAGGIDKLYELYKEGEHEYVQYRLERSLTAEERAYLSSLSGKSVSVAFEHDNYPLSFYNEKDGEFQGIAVDLLKEIDALTGINFESAVDKDASWSEIMAMLKSGDISMVSELVYSDARSADFIWALTPSLTSHYALLSKSDYPDLSPQQVIRARVGAMKDSIYEEMYRLWFSDSSNLIIFNTQNELFDALEKDDIDLMMASEAILLTQTNYREKPGYKVNISFTTPLDSLFGFNKNETELRSIIEKAQMYIDITAIDRRWTTKSFDYATKLALMRYTYLMVFMAILVVILLITMFLFFKTKELSKDLERQTNEAHVASRAKGTFLAHMSHEIRTPLNAIIGMSFIAKKAIADREKAIASIDQIITSSNHLLGILNDVLDMSKIESGKLELSCEMFSIAKAIREVTEIMAARCSEKNINLVLDINIPNEKQLLGDKLRLNQVLINLLGNAVKFTDNKGEIVFSVSAQNETPDNISVCFSVSDNGIGMTGEQLEKLFTPFEQTDSAITSKFGGTGLGLSISQSIVQMMGGIIKAESTPRKGSSFSFCLTFEKGAENSSLPQTIDSVDLHGKRILLAEDIDINREIVIELMDSTGVLIDEAIDGQQAVIMFGKSAIGYYDMIFMDIQMPVMNGHEAAKAIRAMERADAKSVPIVAMTANAYKEDADEAAAAGMNAHVPKPLDMDVLMKTMADLL